MAEVVGDVDGAGEEGAGDVFCLRVYYYDTQDEQRRTAWNDIISFSPHLPPLSVM